MCTPQQQLGNKSNKCHFLSHTFSIPSFSAPYERIVFQVHCHNKHNVHVDLGISQYRKYRPIKLDFTQFIFPVLTAYSVYIMYCFVSQLTECLALMHMCVTLTSFKHLNAI